MTQTRRPYGGLSAAQRRETRRGQLLAGVLDVVGAVGVAKVTVDAVCAAAGLTKRYFYENFNGLDEALVAALDFAYLDLSEQMSVAVTTLDTPAERARVVVEILVDTLAADPRLTRLYVEAPGHAALRARREVAIAEFTDLLRSDAIGIGRALGSPDDQRLAVRLVVAGTTDLVTAWLSGVVDADRDAVVATIVAAGLAVSGPGSRRARRPS